MKKPFYKKWWFITICALFAISAIGDLAGSPDTESALASSIDLSDPESESAPVTSIESNIFEAEPAPASDSPGSLASTSVPDSSGYGAPGPEPKPSAVPQLSEQQSASSAAQLPPELSKPPDSSIGQPSVSSSSSNQALSSSSTSQSNVPEPEIKANSNSSALTGGNGVGVGKANNFDTYSDTEAPEGAEYVGNSNTMKYHHPSCSYVSKMSPENIVALSSRDAAIKNGYEPCQVCFK